MNHHFPCLSVVLLALACGAASAGQPGADLRALLATPAQQRAQRPYDERDWLERFYAPRAYAPAWQGQAAQGVALLQDAAAHGLAPSDYQAESLARQLREARPEDAQRVELALTQAMLHYLADLRVGRVRSEYHSALPDPRLQTFDPVERLRAALAAQRLPAAIAAAQPRLALYQRVKSTLAHYRKLAQAPHQDLPPLAANKLESWGRYEGAKALHARLVQLGDLGADAPLPEKALYTPELVEAVKRFQARHGLATDGVLGRETLAALNVPLTQRMRQLELTLERLRWLPDFSAGRAIAVNLPSYRLWAFESGAAPDTQTVLEMKVIVGTAVKTETPLFVGALRYLEFNPYWNVPRSIERGEIIPKLIKEPGYLAKHDMELVPTSAGGAPLQSVDAETLAGLRAGQYRVRQRPGPGNALGAVKFAMPNAMNIYLHSTSARELFKRTRRDLSHGCIRVERPAELAQFVLADQPKWTAKAIEAAMAPGPTRTVSLKTPIPVVLFYATAVTDRNGLALFAPDIYLRDVALEAALKAGSKAP